MTKSILANILTSFFFLAATLLSTSCATIFHGKTQNINITTDPPGARILAGGNTFVTPAQVSLRRDSDYTIVADKEGYQQSEALLQHSVDWYTFLGNIIFGGLIGWGIDFASGSAYELSPSTVDIQLKPISSQPATASTRPN